MEPLRCFNLCRTEITLGFDKIGLCKLGVFWAICPKILDAVTSMTFKQLLRSYSTKLSKMYSCLICHVVPTRNLSKNNPEVNHMNFSPPHPMSAKMCLIPQLKVSREEGQHMCDGCEFLLNPAIHLPWKWAVIESIRNHFQGSKELWHYNPLCLNAEGNSARGSDGEEVIY